MNDVAGVRHSPQVACRAKSSPRWRRRHARPDRWECLTRTGGDGDAGVRHSPQVTCRAKSSPRRRCRRNRPDRWECLTPTRRPGPTQAKGPRQPAHPLGMLHPYCLNRSRWDWAAVVASGSLPSSSSTNLSNAAMAASFSPRRSWTTPRLK